MQSPVKYKRIWEQSDVPLLVVIKRNAVTSSKEIPKSLPDTAQEAVLSLSA